MKFYLGSIEDALRELGSGNSGLSSDEAGKRLAENGKNKLAEPKKESIIHMFFRQLADPMIIILIVAAVISAVIAITQKSSGGDTSFADVIIISIVVILNAVLGVYQESKAEKAIEALQQMTAATSKVIRDGVMHVIKSEDLVVGDVIVLEAGDSVPADARLIECASLKAEESALTGESVPVNKTVMTLTAKDDGNVPLGDRTNMVYMGSTVVYGHGKAVITAAGMDTEMGKIATALTQAEDGKTPLQMKLGELSKILTYLVIGICAVIFLISAIRTGNFIETVRTQGIKPVIDMFMVAVSLAVAAIPEGLATVVTIVLSMGVTKMSKRNAVIRKLTAVETLGCTQIICSDKTGTLTQNKMTVVREYCSDSALLAEAMALCSDAQIGESGEAEGEPTENALVNYANKLGINKTEYDKKQKRVGEAPFDSMRKMMSTVHEKGGKYVQFTKGAPDEVLKKCTHILKDGIAVPLNDKYIAEIAEQNRSMADDALRVLSAAYRTYEKLPDDFEAASLEHDLIFIGLYGMIDPVRPEVRASIEECRRAGIRPVMITGDHINTAVAIAKELTIISDASEAITGAQLDKISDADFERDVTKYSVYARVQPEHKVRIVNAWRKLGKITAMTGDGVNDAPSIKAADIGVGMGITGTDVTKNVADMVLADDNFATIVTAVEEGRRIYDNIKKSIQFLLSSNLSEVVSIFTATMIGFTLLKPVHLLWINLITDCFPALALGMERSERDVMNRPPRDPKAGIFSGGVGFDCVYQGLMVTVLTLAAYVIGHLIGPDKGAGGWFADSAHGMTMAFLTMSMAEIFHSFNMRTVRKSIFTMKHQNWYLIGAMLLSLILTAAVIFIPGLNDAFGFTNIGLLEYSIAMGLALLVIPTVEIVKLLQRLIHRKKKQK
ncbi:MAG: calcium-translocating P-type ATPase, PMCA-type [Clostridia bacterium]|nr:calcium-translocating P-type ATPase, PMCA-type [Clostridia bacterium]